MSSNQQQNVEKSREEILAEREAAKQAKKAAKAGKSAKSTPASTKSGESSSNTTTTAKQGKVQNRNETNKAESSNAIRSKPPSTPQSLQTTFNQSSNKSIQPTSGRTKQQSNSTSKAFANSLFGNVSLQKNDSEMRQQIISASFKQSIHPSILKVGQHLQSFSIVGADSRAIAVLKALRDFVQDYKTPSGAVMNRDLVSKLAPQINFLVQSRPLGTSVGHAIRYLKYEISITPIDFDEIQSKNHLISRIDHFVRDRITFATQVIANNISSTKIKNDDVILTYGKSSVVEQILLEAWQQRQIKFKVIIIDARPLCEGKIMLKSLTSKGIPCTFGQITNLGSLISKASLVLLGTASLLANGSLFARAGTAPCAMMAYRKGIPVIVCCETYKFSERVQLDSFVINEAGNSEMLLNNNANEEKEEEVSTNIMTKEEYRQIQSKDNSSLSIVNLLYDLTPPKYITAVASEIGLSGPESVGIILRDYKSVLYGQ